MGNFEIHKSLRDLKLDKNVVRLVAFQEKASSIILSKQ